MLSLSVSDGISAVALLLALVSFVQSTRATRYEKQRTIRGQLNEVLKQLAGVMIERQKLQHEHRGEPDYALVLSSAFDQQQTFLLQQARYLTDQIPDLVVSVEYTAMGYFYWLAGDLPAAEANYKKAVDRAPDTTYRLSAITAYSWFLFTQRRFEEAREQYRKGITERTQTDHFARYQKGRTYMFWGFNERNLAQASSLAEQAFESAAAEFRGIDLEALRENALKELNAIKSGQAAIPPMHSESTQAVPPIANT